MDTPRFHPDTIEEVKQRSDIFDIVSDRVVLRKSGKDYKGLCPFHEEKSPSFNVSTDKQVYHCFGCGVGGNVFNFLMELNKQSFSDVVLDLAQRYNVAIKTLEPQQKQEIQRQISLREQLYEILAVTANFYQHALRQPQGENALNYLKNERKLSEETLQKFQLGYAPAGWETLYRYLVETKKYSVTLVAEAGLIKKRKTGQGYYDQFRDRLTIPIFDTKGRIIAFGSRTLTDEKPKYLNSPETTLFNKSKTLFALNYARDTISKEDRAIVVEGYFDAIALHASGISNVVASLGTSFTKDQLQQVLRYTHSKQVILNFDADFAGVNATHRAIAAIEDEIYSGQVQLKVLNLPDGKDADEFLQSSNEAIEIYHNSINNAPLWLDWQIEQSLIGKDLKQADLFQEVAKNMVKLLSKIDREDLRTKYIVKSAELLSQGDAQYLKFFLQDLHLQVKKQLKGTLVTKSKNKIQKNSIVSDVSNPTENNLLEAAEDDLLRIYLHYPEHREQIITAIEDKDLLFTLPHHRFLWQQIIQLQSDRPDVNNSDSENNLLFQLQQIAFNFTDKMSKLFDILYLHQKQDRKEKLDKEDIMRLSLVIQSAIATLEYINCEKYKNYCLQQLQKLDPYKELDKIQYYSQESIDAQKKLAQLDIQRVRHNSDFVF